MSADQGPPAEDGPAGDGRPPGEDSAELWVSELTQAGRDGALFRLEVVLQIENGDRQGPHRPAGDRA